MTTCKEFVTQEKEVLKQHIEGLVNAPTLTILQIGDDFASNKYVAGKIKDCEEVGIVARHYKLSTTIRNKELASLIKTISHYTDGLILQLPVPDHLLITPQTIPPRIDVDGFNPNSKYTPCTPLGIMTILHENNITIDGANIVIIGRSEIVGKPLAKLMLQENATVTICHSHTKNLKEHCLNADIIISAVGSPKLVTADMVKDGSVVIDVGISRSEEGKIIGDCDYPNLVDKCKFITPWVGGVGLLTRLSLLQNTITAYYDKEENYE